MVEIRTTRSSTLGGTLTNAIVRLLDTQSRPGRFRTWEAVLLTAAAA
jgi:hypothetical protein